jgi:hypothetical protein
MVNLIISLTAICDNDLCHVFMGKEIPRFFPLAMHIQLIAKFPMAEQ